jgi:signal transduction histidine kinase
MRMLLALVLNIALLVALTVVHQTLVRHWRPGKFPYTLLSSLLYGTTAILGMMTPFRFAPGIIYDGRSIILGVAGLFGGPWVGAGAAIMAATYRLQLGGPGTASGVAVILEASALGVAFHFLRRRDERVMGWGWLWALAFLIHVLMLAFQLPMPGGSGPDIVRQIALPVLVFFPLGMLLACRLMLDQEERYRREDRLAVLNESLERLVAERTSQLSKANEELASTIEHLREASNAKSDFLASMSHELRTPLNSIIGFSGILLQGLAGSLTEEQENQVRMISSSGTHLLALVSDLLDLSKVEAGKTSPRRRVFDLGPELQKIVDTVSPLADAKGLSLECEIKSSHITLRSDPRMVRQIVLNLLSNAIKFTPQGSIRIETSCEGHEVRVAVADTGPGIAPDDQDRIFDAFERARVEGPQPGPGGTGLGLTISTQLATLLGAELRLHSTPGEGSRFTLVIPHESVEAGSPLEERRAGCDQD